MNNQKPTNPPPYAPLQGEHPQTNQYPYPMPPQGSPQYPGPGQYAQQPVIVQHTQVQVVRGGCPNCGGVLQNEYSACGIVLAVLFFPIGMLCCLMMQEKRCVNCGNTY